MSISSRLRIDDKGMLVTSVFYAVAGIVFLVLLATANYPPHIGIIAMLSIAAAYGIFRKRVWAVWLVVILFFTSTTFAAFAIYNAFAENYILGLGMTAYLVLTWLFTIYVAAKRKALES